MKVLIVVLVVMTSGCATYVTSYDDAGNKLAKTPAALVALTSMQADVNRCQQRVSSDRASLLSRLDTGTEGGRLAAVIISMQGNEYAGCNSAMAQVVSEFQATDRARLNIVNRAVGVGGFVVGGYLLGSALEGIVTAATKNAGPAINNNGGQLSYVGEVRTSGNAGTGGGGGRGGSSADVASNDSYITSNFGTQNNNADTALAVQKGAQAITSPAGPVAVEQTVMNPQAFENSDVSGTVTKSDDIYSTSDQQTLIGTPNGPVIQPVQ